MTEAIAILRDGGWVMAPIALCSVVAAAIILERSFALRRQRVIDPALTALTARPGSGAPAGDVLEACQGSPSPFARIIEETIHARELGRAQAVETMHATGRSQMGTLQRGLTVLEIIAGVSPLLGLLGTVLGMVTVFNAITAEGIGNPQVLSAGISQALVTTVAGLSVAIPALAAHSWFSRRVEELATEMHERATVFVARLFPGGDEDSGGYSAI